MTLTRSYTDALERSLALVIQGFQQRADLAVAEARLSVAELTAQLAAAKAEVLGLREEMKAHAGDLVAKAVEALPKPEPVDLSGLVTREEAQHAAQNLRDDATEMAERIKALETRPAPEPVDLALIATKDDLLEAALTIRSAIPQPVEMPDLSGFARREEVEAIRAAIPQMPEPVDLSPYATLEAVEEVRAAIPTLPEPVDLSPFATREDVDALRREIPELPEPKDWGPYLEEQAVTFMKLWTQAEDKTQRQIERLAERPGVFPVVRSWSDDGVTYAGHVVTHDGALWQARRDTGKAPGHDDWVCIVQKGEQGFNGRSMVHRGTYDPAAGYVALDAVTLNGSSFLALTDEPGPCPGDGWQLMASRGSRGKDGEPGKSIKGEKGDDGAEVAAFYIDAEKDAAVIVLSNGTTHEASLYDWGLKVAQ